MKNLLYDYHLSYKKSNSNEPKSDTDVTTTLIIKDKESMYSPKYNENNLISANVGTFEDMTTEFVE